MKKLNKILVVLGSATVIPAHAATLIWTNTAGGNWNVAANWTPNQIPGASDTAIITNNGEYSVTLVGDRTIAGLILGGESGTQTLAQVSSLYDLTLTGPGVVGRNGRYNLNRVNFTGTNVLFDLLDKTRGDMEATKFRQTAASFELKAGSTASGWGVKFDEGGQNTLADPFVMEWKGGKLVTVWPEGAAVSKPALVRPFSK